MKRNIHLLYVILLFCFFTSCNQPSDVVPKSENRMVGHLFVKNNSLSFGTIKQSTNTPLLSKFVLKNTGNCLVNVSDIDVSCGCMSASITSKFIRPGESQLLTVTINPKGQTGYFNKSLFVNSDADNSTLILRIKGEIVE